MFHLKQLPLAHCRPNGCLNQIARNASTSAGKSDDYQFLQNSNMNTYYFQKSLPRLPIPKVDKTLERYLAAQRPLCTDEEFKTTESFCKKFMKSGKAKVQNFHKQANTKITNCC